MGISPRRGENLDFHPIWGYIFGTLLASSFYAMWTFTVFAISSIVERPSNSLHDVAFMAFFSVFFTVCGGSTPAFILLLPLWAVTVIVARKLALNGPFAFAGYGAAAVFTTACATASVAPKPLFIEDQSFLEGAITAAERQGLCFCLAGAIFGVTYWALSANRPAAGKMSPEA